MLYGITGALFAYCITLIVSSTLAAFAIVAGYQIIMFVVSTVCPTPESYSTKNALSFTWRATYLSLRMGKQRKQVKR